MTTVILSSVVGICWLVFVFYWLVSSLYVKRSMTKRDYGWVIPRIIAVLAVVLLIRMGGPGGHGAASNLAPALQSHFSFPVPGTLVTILGLAGAVWARISLGRNWSGYVTYKQDHELVTSGPYRFIRHPIYTGLIVMFIGTFLYYGSLFVLILFIILTVMFLLRVGKEEAIMKRLFGKKYTDYMKTSKRLIPFIY
jgi:hypothetical protein